MQPSAEVHSPEKELPANGEAAAARAERCRNCGARLVGPFCAECGQEARRKAVPAWQFGREALGEVFSFDARLLRTLGPLLFKPGFLTNEYFAGRRKRYVPPLRMYVFVSFVFFLLLTLGSSPERAAVASRKGLRAGARAPVASVDTSAQRAAPAPPRSFSAKMRAAEKHGGQIVVRHLSAIFFLAVPLLALVLKLLYWRSQRFFVQHLVFAFHVQAFMFAMFFGGSIAGRGLDVVAPASEGGQHRVMLLWGAGTIDSFASSVLWIAVVAAIGAYFLVAVRRVYRQPWWKTVAKTGFAAVGYVMVFVLAVFGVIATSAALFY